MKLPPSIAKVPRELGRIGYQFDDLLYRTFGIAVTLIYGRMFVDPRVSQFTGSVPMGRKVAIYLIFPKDGLLQSHFIALDYIRRCGYTPLVVSNLPLTRDEKRQLLQKCGKLVVRPNYGYDFGGYRDAVRALGPDLQQMDYLAIFNDSNWFPVHPDINWLAEAEAKGLDYVGSVSHGGLPDATSFEPGSLEWRIDTSRPRFHYGSFSILIGPKIVRSKGFYDFWMRYRVTSNKSLTIRRGEIGLSQWVIRNGFSHGETLDARDLPALLAQLPPDRVLQIARNAITFDRLPPTEARRAILSAQPPDHTALVAFILNEVFKSGQAYALQDFDTINRNGNFIKKSPVSLNEAAAEQTLRILDQLASPEAAVFRAEALQIYRRNYPGSPV